MYSLHDDSKQNTATKIESRLAHSATGCHQLDMSHKNKSFKAKPELLQYFGIR